MPTCDDPYFQYERSRFERSSLKILERKKRNKSSTEVSNEAHAGSIITFKIT